MITSEDLTNMGYYESHEDYNDYKEKARLRCMTPLAMVKEFSETMDLEMGAEWKDSEVWDERTNRIESLRYKLVDEEFAEFQEAGTAEECLKELCDLIYVAYGYGAAFGWDVDEALRRVHRNNLERCIWPDGLTRTRGDGKKLKCPTHPKVDLSDLV